MDLQSQDLVPVLSDQALGDAKIQIRNPRSFAYLISAKSVSKPSVLFYGANDRCRIFSNHVGVLLP